MYYFVALRLCILLLLLPILLAAILLFLSVALFRITVSMGSGFVIYFYCCRATYPASFYTTC